MQRDSYAILIKKKGRPTLDILIQQMSREITREKMFDEVFDGYDARRIILMTHMAKSKAPNLVPGGGPLLPSDIIVDKWDTLVKIHKPNYMYRLLPLVCSTPTAFSALMGICQTPKSPFTIDDRKDQVAYRQHFWQSGPAKNVVDQFFRKRYQAALSNGTPEKATPHGTEDAAQKDAQGFVQLPITSVDFDGVLISKDQKSIGFVRMCPIITPQAINTLADMVDLSLSPEYKDIAPNGRNLVEFGRYTNRFKFLASEQTMLSPTGRKQVAEAAAHRGIIIKWRRGSLRTCTQMVDDTAWSMLLPFSWKTFTGDPSQAVIGAESGWRMTVRQGWS